MKRFLSIILVGMVIVVVVFGPLSLKKAEAQAPATGELVPENELPSLKSCVPVPFMLDMTDCIAALSYYILFVPTSWILWMGGQFFNGAVSFALGGEFLKSDMVSIGWTITRNVANLFFIFILLYIAIATILQISSYGMKSLLAKLIIIALLVNFSLVITKIIIDASNILAMEFYNKMTVQGGAVTQALFGQNARDISAVFVAGFNPQQLFGKEGFEKWKENTSGSSLAMLFLFLIASLMNLVATFVLMAGGLLFIIRVSVLWLLMILAPIAFLFMVLPLTKQYASQWWNKLFSQAFFAPAFLFLFYLVAMLIKKGFLKSIFESAGRNTSGLSGFEAFFATIAIVFLNFTVLTVLMIACLIVAQKMGAMGAGTVMGWGKAAGKWGRGVAGRATRRTAIARPVRAVAESKWAQRFAAVSPRFGGAMLRTAQKGAKVGGLDKITEAKVATGMSLRTSELRASYLQRADRRTQEAMFKQMSARDRADLYNRNEPLYNNLLNILSLEERDKTEKERREVGRRNIVNNLYNTQTNTVSTTFTNDVRQVRPDEVKDLNMGIFRDAAGVVQRANIDAMIRAFSGTHITKMYERGDEASNLFFQQLSSLGNTSQEIADRLRTMGNNAGASWALTPGAAAIIEAYRSASQPPPQQQRPFAPPSPGSYFG